MADDDQTLKVSRGSGQEADTSGKTAIVTTLGEKLMQLSSSRGSAVEGRGLKDHLSGGSGVLLDQEAIHILQVGVQLGVPVKEGVKGLAQSTRHTHTESLGLFAMLE